MAVPVPRAILIGSSRDSWFLIFDGLDRFSEDSVLIQHAGMDHFPFPGDQVDAAITEIFFVVDDLGGLNQIDALQIDFPEQSRWMTNRSFQKTPERFPDFPVQG
jgi:hypothetical protein